MSFTEIAAAAIRSLSASPYLASSDNDQAHQCGLWAARKGIAIFSVRKSRGHTWVINGMRRGGWQLDFSNSNTSPDYQAF